MVYLNRDDADLIEGMKIEAERLRTGSDLGSVLGFEETTERALRTVLEMERRGFPARTVERAIAHLAAAEEEGMHLRVRDDEAWREVRRRNLHPEHPDYPR